MRKPTFSPTAIIFFLCLSFSAFAQEKCLTEILFREEAAKNPSLLQKRQEQEQRMADYMTQGGTASTSATKIIPVVFHIIHDYGAENISRNQCLNQVKILNDDFQRLNADTNATPAAFKSKAGKLDIQFRMAQKDPNGNCTDGVVRVNSSLTVNARDNVKALSYWPSNQYLNIWVVRTIQNFSNTAGIILGYAQFPGMGSPLTDGIVLRHDYTGAIGSAASTAYKGRTATHEVGHWLDLRHIWGDDTDCNGTDQVSDTPNQQVAATGCPAYPKTDPCTPTGSGIMFMNYMDYTDGPCQNMFSVGQCSRMDAALATNSSRSNLYTPANLAATGTDGLPVLLCAPRADFKSTTKRLCMGASVTYTDVSWRGPGKSRKWSFPGGNPASSTDSIPVVQYAAPGTYDVKLVVTNDAGSDSVIKNAYTIVLPDTAAYTSTFYSEGFETTTSIPNGDWAIYNPDNGVTWKHVNTVGASGSASVKLENFGSTVGQADELYSPGINVSAISKPSLTFKVAHARKNTSDADSLKVYISTNCGQTWNLRYSESGSRLQTTGGIASATAFTPTATQWRQETINLSSFATATNVSLKFRFTAGGGNNLYLDDINIKSPTGINDETVQKQFSFSVYPNPVQANAVISFKLEQKQHLDLRICDVLGREVLILHNNMLAAGDHRFPVRKGLDLKPGIYMVKLTASGNTRLLQKIIIE